MVAAPTGTSGTADAASAVRVLLVEDDEDDVILTRQMLADIDPVRFELAWEADYERGIHALCSGRYDVCLVDYRLGVHNGVEFVREAVGQGCRVPVILLTGMGDHAVDVAAMNAGAADYLSKIDLRPADLERAIRYAMQHRRAEEQRIKLLTEQAARARAEEANRAKDEFLAALSHELRTPLTPVLMAVDALEQEPQLPEPVREAVALVKRNVELEARLIDDLLDLTRVAHGKLDLRREPVDVHAQLRHAAETCGLHPGAAAPAQAQDKRLELVFRPEAVCHWATGDPARLQQVFWNLLKNSIKFTPDGGRIEVRTYNTRPEQVNVEVKDTGIGIEPDALARIFNAFEQADQSVTRQFGGLGLGLAICKALVDLHGGTISAHSEGKGRGATFTVTLPTVIAPVAPSGRDPCGPPASACRPGRILLVEDHPDTRRLMAKLLARQGHSVASAGTLADALALARSEAFDLVISDIGLPDGSGLDLMRQLQQLHQSAVNRPLRGLALSGYGMEHDVRQSEQAGFSAHLTKPVNLPQLQQTVVRLLTEGQGQESA